LLIALDLSVGAISNPASADTLEIPFNPWPRSLVANSGTNSVLREFRLAKSVPFRLIAAFCGTDAGPRPSAEFVVRREAPTTTLARCVAMAFAR